MNFSYHKKNAATMYTNIVPFERMSASIERAFTDLDVD